MPNGSPLQLRDKAGAGVTSLFVNYGQLPAAHVTRSFNDEAPWAAVNEPCMFGNIRVAMAR